MADDLNPMHLGQATDRFQRAHFQALLQDWLANLRGVDPDLLNYEEVRSILEAREGVGKQSTQNIPLEKIVGSVGRYRDFNRTFLPRNEALLERWRRVDAAMHSFTGVPPIDLYQIGDLYFVRDGNHRVSVARTRGDKTIDAYVTQVDAPFPVEADSAETLSEWLTEAGQRLFLERTQLQRHFPDADIRLTAPGRYRQFDEQIVVHRYFLGLAAQREISYEEAVQSWYANVYLPLTAAIHASGILKEFPKRTLADLFLWICQHREDLRQQYNLDLDERAAVSTFASVYSDLPLRKAWKGARLAAARLAGGEHVLVGLPDEAETADEPAEPTDPSDPSDLPAA